MGYLECIHSFIALLEFKEEKLQTIFCMGMCVACVCMCMNVFGWRVTKDGNAIYTRGSDATGQRRSVWKIRSSKKNIWLFVYSF